MVLCLILLLTGAALAAPVIRSWRSAAFALLPLPFAAVAGVLVWHAPVVLRGETPREVLARVAPLQAELALRLDGLGLLFALLVCVIGVAVLVHATGYFAKDARLLARFATLAYAFAAAMVGLVLADDLLLLFICWELTSVCSFLLIGLQHDQEQARSGALRALLVTGGGGIALLVGLLLLASAADTTSIGVLLERGDAVRASSMYVPALLLILLGAFTKSAQVPFHYWLPGAMAAPGPVSAFLHSATLVKAGVFLLARLHPVLGFRPEWHVILGHAGALTLLVGALLAFGQDDLKRMLAFTTVAGLGTLVLLLGIGTEPALQAALLFVVVHALYKACLFLLVGFLEKRTGTRDVRALSGLAVRTPVAFLVAVLAGLSMSGLPPVLGSIAKELVYEAKLGAPEAPRLLALVGTVGNVLIVACAILVAVSPFVGEGVSRALRPVASRRLLAGPALLALLGLLLGISHDSFVAPLIAAALDVVRAEPTTAAFQADAAPLAVAWLGKATLAGGVLAFLFRRWLLAGGAWLARFASVGPTVLHARAVAGLYALGGHVAAIAGHDVVRRSLLAGFVLLLFAGAVLLVDAGSGWSLPSFRISIHHALLVLLAAAGAIGAARARTTLGAIAALGVAGFGVGMLFLTLGGPDLALTQIAVETLAVLLLLTVLGRAPLVSESTGRGMRDTLLALAVGATFTGLTWSVAPDGALRALARDVAAASEPLGYGRNVVNVILVDFRALDTLGEIFVLVIAACGVSAVLASSPAPTAARASNPSAVLRAAARSIVPLLGLLALVLFLRGHHEPGGGFVGGLVAAAALLLHSFAFGVADTRARVKPERLAALGLALALVAGGLGLLVRGDFLAGLWLGWQVPAIGKLGTPLLFDAGVFLVVVGVTTRVLFDLFEREGAHA